MSKLNTMASMLCNALRTCLLCLLFSRTESIFFILLYTGFISLLWAFFQRIFCTTYTHVAPWFKAPDISNTYLFHVVILMVWGAVASWLVRSSPDRAVRVRALARDIVSCSWARHFTLTVPLSAQVYKWVPANLMLGVTLRWTSIPSSGE